MLRMTSCCTLLPPSGVFVFFLRLAGANVLEEISLIAEQLWGAHLLGYVAGVLGHGSQLQGPCWLHRYLGFLVS